MNTLSLQQHDNDPQEQQQQQQDRIDVIDHSDHQSNSSSSDDELITTTMDNNNNNNNNNNNRSITHMFTRLLKHSSRRIIGIALIASVVIIWVGSSEAIQFVFRDLSFDKPLFLTYYNTSLFSLYLIGFLFVPRWRRSLVYCYTRRRRRRDQKSFHNHNNNNNNHNNNNNNNSEHYYYDIPYTLMTSLLMCPLWFLANVTFNYSLSKTSVASNTVISNTSSLFTFVLCLLLRIDQFSFMRFVAIGFSIGGVALVTVYDSHRNNNNSSNNNNSNSNNNSNDNRTTMIGNLLTLFSAFMYGTYTTLLKIRSPEIHDNNNNNNSINNDNSNNASISPVVDGVVPIVVVDDDEKNNNNNNNINKRSVSMPMVFGFMGLFNILMLWPLFFIVHGLNIEQFSWFPSKKVFVAITLNGLIGTMLSDLLWAFSVVFTSPIVSTIGLALTIPLAFTSDVFIHQTKSFSAAYLLGSSLIICSFVMVNISYQLPAKIRAYDSPSFQWLINRLPSELQQVLLLSSNSSSTQPSTAAYATLLDSMDSSSNSATTETPQSVDDERI